MRFLLDDFEKIVCAVIFIVMTVLGFANVVVRYLTSYSFASTQEVLLNGFLLMTVFGAAIAARRGEHLAVTLLSDILPEGARKAVILFATALSVGLLVLSAWYSADLLFNQYVSGVTSAGLGLPAWYYSLGVPLGFLLIALRLIQSMIGDSREGGDRA